LTTSRRSQRRRDASALIAAGIVDARRPVPATSIVEGDVAHQEIADRRGHRSVAGQ
jgi:hypothetical protein